MEENEKLGMHAGAPPVIFERASLLRATMTVEECIVWDFLKHRPLGFKFRRQHPFNLYILDFYSIGQSYVSKLMDYRMIYWNK